MAENSTDVYDFVFPSPPALQQLAAIAVAVKLWREQVGEHRLNNTLDKFGQESNISLDSVRPHLPSTILPIIENYTTYIQGSLCRYDDEYRRRQWLLESLSKFDDIVCDVDGTINYDRTARRALLCEEISDVYKFEIACLYCLEDDIMRIWPSVSNLESLNLSDDDFSFIEFHQNSLLCYWICRLRNELHRIPIFLPEKTIDEHLMEILVADNWSSIRYFWCRLKNVESRVANAWYLLERRTSIFCRYILAKLNEEELDALIAKANEHYGFMYCVFKKWYFRCGYYEIDKKRACVLTTWHFVRHKINTEEFIRIVDDIFSTQKYGEDEIEIPNGEFFSREFWNDTPDHLKRWMFEVGLLERSFFEINNLSCATVRDNWLLFAVLEEAPFEAKSSFWRENWRNILVSIKPTDLQRLMNLCMKNDSDVELFKKNNLSRYENISVNCSMLMDQSRWTELEEFLNFCCSEKETNLALRIKCLNSHLSTFQNTTDHILMSRKILKNILQFSTFVDDTYCDDLILASDFKNRVLFSPGTMRNLSDCVAGNKLEKVMKFVDTFVMSEQAAVDFKEHHFLPAFVNILATETYRFKFEYDAFEKFMRWCFGSDDKIKEFKSTIPVEDILRRVAQDTDASLLDAEGMSYQSSQDRAARELYFNLHKFLQWVFSSSEEVAEFEKKFSGFEEHVSKE
ncbi:uncharacterized protein LOC135832928 [Planococcus citri]|uniref:uncharacterized protein LOC135832928 n=1 Tax=Planococcus citri TaxID=170843 RepID=UPI0031F9F6C8